MFIELTHNGRKHMVNLDHISEISNDEGNAIIYLDKRGFYTVDETYDSVRDAFLMNDDLVYIPKDN